MRLSTAVLLILPFLAMPGAFADSCTIPDQTEREGMIRIEVTVPDHPVPLALPFDFQVRLPRPDVRGIFVMMEGVGENQRNGEKIGDGTTRIVRDDGLTKTVEFTPLQIGTIQAGVMVIFNDGKIGEQLCQLRVVPSSKGLKKFHLNQGFGVTAIVLRSEKDEDRRRWLQPEVYYSDLNYPIYLKDSTLLNLTVEQPEDHPVIRVDPNGLLHGLRPGKARVTGDFDGVKDSVVVTVYAKGSAPAGIY